MTRWMGFFLALILSSSCLADDAIPIGLDTVKINLHDKHSIARGAKFFATTCMVCHTLIYMRYDPVAQKAGITYEKMPVNITKWPFDVKPPDLSLEVSRRGSDWVYTYLHSFYKDSSRPTGTNNLLLPNAAMTDVLMGMQGQQVRLPDSASGKSLYHKKQWYDVLEQQTPGNMSPEKFDATITDVVNFLTYASEPYKVEQENIGKWVLGYLFVLFILIYLLKQAYWKDFKRSKHDRS